MLGSSHRSCNPVYHIEDCLIYNQSIEELHLIFTWLNLVVLFFCCSLGTNITLVLLVFSFFIPDMNLQIKHFLIFLNMQSNSRQQHPRKAIVLLLTLLGHRKRNKEVLLHTTIRKKFCQELQQDSESHYIYLSHAVRYLYLVQPTINVCFDAKTYIQKQKDVKVKSSTAIRPKTSTNFKFCFKKIAQHATL